MNRLPPDGFNNLQASFTACSSDGDPETGTNIEEKSIATFKIQVFLVAHHDRLELIHLPF